MTDDDDMTGQQSMSPIMSLVPRWRDPGACLRCDYPCSLKHAAAWPSVARQLIDVPAVYDDQTLRGPLATHTPGTARGTLSIGLDSGAQSVSTYLPNNQRSMVADDLGVSETRSTDAHIFFAMNGFYVKGVAY